MPCHAKNARGQLCKRRCAGPYCATHAHGKTGEGFAADMFKAAAKNIGKAALNVAKKVAAPITRRIKAIREGPANKPTGRFQNFLEKTSGKKVVKLQLGRKPILKPVKMAMDAMSFGKFSQKQKELDYDEIYHQYTLFELDDGSQWKIEKNHVVEFFPATKKDFQGEVWEIPIRPGMNVKSMIETAAANDSDFWKYRAGSNNCQAFTREVIVRNNLMPDETDPAKVQDAKALADSLPAATHAIPNLVTDLAATADRVYHGDGVGKHQNDRVAIRRMLFN